MILNFKTFEKLGYNEDVAKLTEYVWNEYKNGNYIIDLSNYSKENLPFFINKLELREYNDSDDGFTMSALYDDIYYRKTRNFVITINISTEPTISVMEHELKHMYDYLITGGKYIKLKDAKKTRPLLSIISKNDNINSFLYIIYLIQTTEIAAFYHDDIRRYKSNEYEDFKEFLPNSKLNRALNNLCEFNISEIISNISKSDKIDIMYVYYDSFGKYELLDYYGLRLKYETYKKKLLNYFTKKPKYSDEQIDRFFNNIKKDIEIKKKLYRKYIERLWSYFNN